MSGQKMRYIGGDIELDLSLFSRQELHDYKDYFSLNSAADYAWVSMGREAFKLALMTEKLREGDEVLIPSFLCTRLMDVLEEFRLTYKMFEIGKMFEVASKPLLNLISQKTKAVIFINYFGLASPDFHLLETIKEKNGNIAIILDYAQALFAINEDVLKSNVVDYIITSLRKFLPIPDGAFLISNKKQIDKVSVLSQPSQAVFEKGLGKIVKHYYLTADCSDASLEKLYLDLVDQPEHSFNLTKGVHAMSAFSYALLKRIDLKTVVERRRENVRYLYRHLDATLLPRWDEKSVLLVLPILLKNRDRIRSALMKHRIYLPVHWPLDERIDRKQHATAHQLSSEILGLVIDQRYDLEEMHYLVSILEKVLSDN